MGVETYFRFRSPVTREDLRLICPLVRCLCEFADAADIRYVINDEEILLECLGEEAILHVRVGDAHPYWASVREYLEFVESSRREPLCYIRARTHGNVINATLLLFRLVKGESMELSSDCEDDMSFYDALRFMTSVLGSEILGTPVDARDWRAFINPCTFTEYGPEFCCCCALSRRRQEEDEDESKEL